MFNIRFNKFSFISIFCLIIFLFTFPFAGDTQENNTPSITGITIATTSGGQQASVLDLTENSTTTVYIHGSASDADTCQEIDAVSGSSSWQVAFYRSNVSGAQNCTEDGLNCYQDTENNADLINCDNPGDTTLDYEMDIPIQYYADATDAGSSPDFASTDWTAYVEVIDDNSASVYSTSTIEINTLKALSTNASVNYGTIALNSESDEQFIVISNTGNDNDLDPLVSDTGGWTCTIGAFTSDYVKFNTTGGLGWSAGTSVMTSASDLNNMSISKSTGGTNPTGTVYFTLKIPPNGVGGTCSSSLIVGN